MKKQWLKKADRFCGLPACLAGRFVSSVFRKQAKENSTLILRPGGMGDLIVAQAALEFLLPDQHKKCFWLIERRSEIWARQCGLNYSCYDDRLPVVLRKLRWGFQRIINTEQFFGLSQAMALWAAVRGSRVYSFSTNRCSVWGTDSIPYQPAVEFEGAAFLRLFERAFEKEAGTGFPLRQRMVPAKRGTIVGISGRDEESRRFSAEEFVRLIQHLAGEDELLEIAFSPADESYARSLLPGFGGRARLLETGFPGLCQALAESKRVIGIDGGMVHMASYFGVPVTAFFTAGVSAKWHPWSEGSAVFRREDLSCQPCTRFGQVPVCRNEFRCKDWEKARIFGGIQVGNQKIL